MKTSSGFTIEKKYGIRSHCIVKKNSVDDPFREAPVSIVFGMGIDDIRENLLYRKEVKGDPKFILGEKEFIFLLICPYGLQEH